MRILVYYTIYLFISYAQTELDYCLKPNGCYQDECCFQILSKTGPICDLIPGCVTNFKPDCCRNSRSIHTNYGQLYGYAISLDEDYGYRENAKRYLQIWRGIPYASPPTRENNLRFRKPLRLKQSDSKFDATYFRSSCSQPSLNPKTSFPQWSKSIHEWYRRLPLKQTENQIYQFSEDCLYLNIYNMNETDYNGFGQFPGQQKLYPILVIFDGLDHLSGNVNRYPGHVLAQLGLVVITVNYRLGPFGYLATHINNLNQSNSFYSSDDYVSGNYGLWDQVQALEFIREIGSKFLGDINQITVLGHGSAAGDVALHLLSKYSGLKSPPLFHRAILMSGSDQTEGGFVRYPNESEAYAKQLAHQVGCSSTDWKNTLTCLRSRTAMELANTASQTRIHKPNWISKPWAPTIDGDFIEADPKILWKKGHFAHIPLIGGLCTDDGSYHAFVSMCELYYDNQNQNLNRSEWNIINATNMNLELFQLLKPNSKFDGIMEEQMHTGFLNMAKNDFAMNPVGMANTLSFQYTYWPDISNSVKRWSQYRLAWTDRFYGSGIFETLKYHADFRKYQSKLVNNTQMYVFAYKSVNDLWSSTFGTYFGSDLQYLFGLPYLQLYKTNQEIDNDWPIDLNLEPLQFKYSKLDVNITNYMLSFISNFVKNGNATPNLIRNLTWDTFRSNNRTYLWINLTSNSLYAQSNRPDLEYLGIGSGFDLRQNYQTEFYGYWNYLYEQQLKWLPRFELPPATPEYLENYRLTCLILSGLLAFLCLILMALLIIYHRRRKLLI